MSRSIFKGQFFDALDTADLVKSGQVSATEVLEESIARVEAVNPTLNFMAVKAYDVGRKIVSKPLNPGPFAGVPFLQKDIGGHWPGVRVANGCRMWKDFVVEDSTPMFDRLMKSGMVMLGNSTTPDWGWGINTHTQLHGISRNPWNLDLTPGGSSGGAGAAVASRTVPIAHASDAGGSTRIPAAFNGLVGLKPSRGRVPFEPDIVDPIFGLPTEGCLTVSVRDTAAYFDVVSKSIPGDVYYHPPLTETFLAAMQRPRKNLRIAYVTVTPSGKALSAEGRAGVQRAAKLCADLGHHVEEADVRFDFNRLYGHIRRISHVTHLGMKYMTEMMVGRVAGPDDLSDFMHKSSEEGLKISAIEHMVDAEAVRMFSRIIATATAPYDVVITPVVDAPPPHVDWNLMWGPDRSSYDVDAYHDALRDYLQFTIPFNCSGQPAISLPLHWTQAGVPFGIQFLSAYGQEALLLNLAAQLESAAPWRDKVPPCNSLSKTVEKATAAEDVKHRAAVPSARLGVARGN